MVKFPNSALNQLDGRATATHKGHKAGREQWIMFADSQMKAGVVHKYLDQFTVDDFKDGGKTVRNSFGCFAQFLTKAMSDKNKHFKPDTQIQYLSSAKTYLATRFKDIKLLKDKETESDWYTELYVSRLLSRKQ